ncbi:MAG: tetratricopeptide repeat protein, partial [Cyclonatronaceae bacterium]
MLQRAVLLGCFCLFSTLLLWPYSGKGQHAPTPDAATITEAITLYDEGQFEAAITAFSGYLELDKGERLRRQALYYTTLSRAALQPKRAELFYDVFVADYPRSPEAMMLFVDLGHRARSAGELAEANQFYERALALPPDPALSPRLLYWNAEVYIEREMPAEAHENYARLPLEFPDSQFAPQSLYSRGRLYLDAEDFEAAAEMFEQLRADYRNAPITSRVGTALGEAYYRQARYEEAISSLRSALSSLDDEQQAKASLIMAESYNYLDDLSNATTWYRRYIQLKEGQEEERLARYGLGWVYHKQGVYHWAAEAFGEAVTAQDELSEKALYYEAINHKLAGRYELALQSFERFSEMFSSGEWLEKAYFEWAVILYEIGDHVSAIERLLFVVRTVSPLEYPGEIYTLLGEAYFANAEYTRAIAAFEQAEESGMVTPEVKLQAQFQRAWVLFQNRAYDEAQPVFERVYTQGRDTDIGKEALSWSAESFFSQEQYTAAADRFRRFLNDEQARQIDAQLTAAARYSLGWSYFMLGEYEAAIAPLRSFLDNFTEPEIAMFPYDVDAQLRLADAHVALRRYNDAITYYDEAADFPESADYATY